LNISELAARVLDIIPDARHWAKGSMRGGWGHERYCVLGAVAKCLNSGSAIDVQAKAAFEAAVCDKADELFPRSGGSWNSVPSFNDAGQTRYAHVRQVLEKLRAG
jgi:hypothetical protein